MLLKKVFLLCCVCFLLVAYNNCSPFQLDPMTEEVDLASNQNSNQDSNQNTNQSTNPGVVYADIKHSDHIPQLSSGKPDTKHVSDFSNYIDEKFKLFWHVPTRAYPGIELDFQLIYYEADNQSIEFSLQGAPSGMKISGGGKISWKPTSAQSGKHSFTIHMKRADGQTLRKTTTLNVSTGAFIFVSPNGSDSNSGSRSSPLKTIRHAIGKVANKSGKTIYLESGTYNESMKRTALPPMYGKNFSPEDPLVIQGLPGETAVLDTQGKGSGIVVSGTSYIAIKNITIKNAVDGDGGGIVVWSKNVVLQHVFVKDGHGSANNNVTGFLIQSSLVVLDRCRAENNIDPNDPYFHNNSNYLFYTEVPASNNSDAKQTDYKPLWVLNSYSKGSHIGYKIKHSGSRKLIIHNNTSEDDIIGYGLSSTHSSVRYNMAINSKFAGIKVGVVDLSFGGGRSNSFAKGKMLVEHNLIYNKKPYDATMVKNSGAATGLWVDSWWAKSVIFHKNIIYNENGGSRAIWAWPYIDSSTSVSFDGQKNVYHFNSNYDFKLRKTSISGLSGWGKAVNSESSSRTEKPNFANKAELNFQPIANSSALFTGGEFAGPIKPK